MFTRAAAFLSAALLLNISVVYAASSIFRTNPQVIGKTDNEVILSYQWEDGTQGSMSLPIPKDQVGLTLEGTPFSWKNLKLEELRRYSKVSFYRETDSTFGQKTRVDITRAAMLIFLPSGERAYLDWRGNPVKPTYQFEDKTQSKLDGILDQKIDRVSTSVQSNEEREFFRTGFFLHQKDRKRPLRWVSFSDRIRNHSERLIGKFSNRDPKGRRVQVLFDAYGAKSDNYGTKGYYDTENARLLNSLEIEEIYETFAKTKWGADRTYWILARRTDKRNQVRYIYSAYEGDPSQLKLRFYAEDLRVEYVDRDLVISFPLNDGRRVLERIDGLDLTAEPIGGPNKTDSIWARQNERRRLEPEQSIIDALTTPEEAARIRRRNRRISDFVQSMDKHRKKCEKHLK